MKQFVAPSKKLIDGVKIKELKTIVDDRGCLMEILRCDEEFFCGSFGQVYVTVARPGIAKSAHYHVKQMDHFCCVSGLAKIVLYDMREESPTYKMLNEIHMGTDCRKILKIPPRIGHGFTAIGSQEAMIVNVTNNPYNREDPDEYRIDPSSDEFPYDWHKCVDG